MQGQYLALFAFVLGLQDLKFSERCADNCLGRSSLRVGKRVEGLPPKPNARAKGAIMDGGAFACQTSAVKKILLPKKVVVL